MQFKLISLVALLAITVAASPVAEVGASPAITARAVKPSVRPPPRPSSSRRPTPRPSSSRRPSTPSSSRRRRDEIPLPTAAT
ncbi:hypothetical protein HGRIS_003068 [Hohenbuehelia grisea]|uniref:Uncharacterized protein n=1 Tax=Hohenbuehelia grisea TaxID=104357 RepID=A0ABR3JMJ5_9AGAR